MAAKLKKTTSKAPGKSKSAATKASTKKEAPAKKLKPLKEEPAPKVDPKEEAKKAEARKKLALDMSFVGFFPIRKGDADKKIEQKKTSSGPVFVEGSYKAIARTHQLGRNIAAEFETIYKSKFQNDGLSWDFRPSLFDEELECTDSEVYSRKHPSFFDIAERILNGQAQMAVLNLREVPLDLPEGLVLGGSFKREDPRDAMVTRSTYGAIQELPRNAKVGVSAPLRSMQIRNLRPDIQFVHVAGNVEDRLKALESQNLDAVIVSWAGLRRLNLSPRFYVALLPEHVTPASSQGIIGVICRDTDNDLLTKLRYIEDSEASWAARCERAFLLKFGAYLSPPVGVYAHRKGTQDPWILDSVIGDPNTGELLRHREIGTSRCKPESLADKAFAGIIGKGARKYLPFRK